MALLALEVFPELLLVVPPVAFMELDGDPEGMRLPRIVDVLLEELPVEVDDIIEVLKGAAEEVELRLPEPVSPFLVEVEVVLRDVDVVERLELDERPVELNVELLEVTLPPLTEMLLLLVVDSFLKPEIELLGRRGNIGITSAEIKLLTAISTTKHHLESILNL